MSPPGTFERVYAAIKDQLRKGVFRPGERLEPAAFCEDLNASVTPIRDALHRLTGERLVETPRHEGFRVPLLTETMLRHLYAWHLDLLLLATAKHRLIKAAVGESEDRGPGLDQLERQNAIFLELAASTGNPEHLIVLRSLTERMEPYQRFEAELLDAIETETENIATAIRGGDRKTIRKSLIAYHRKRARIIPEILSRARPA